MTSEETKQVIEQLKQFAKRWNELYAAEKFEEMKYLATEDVGIANAKDSKEPSGLIYGRDKYYEGIVNAYGKEKNLLVMKYENWEYIPLDDNTFYTIGKYTLEPKMVGVNCWLLRRNSPADPWRIFRVIDNNDSEQNLT
ncbi:hypothetical protein [Nostoc sp. WHI]|uniref:hypothetical protein n=1 Tax=Nostoc sp. WHI TaxID=2650611 RepID=UPI0018C7DA72|nr:hypothetical protein [Nostoc sp. WHI]MBG1272045.1 hypothetical protein [Nostoc sp. WHI]